jgi:hypothetical protein
MNKPSDKLPHHQDVVLGGKQPDYLDTKNTQVFLKVPIRQDGEELCILINFLNEVPLIDKVPLFQITNQLWHCAYIESDCKREYKATIVLRVRSEEAKKEAIKKIEEEIKKIDEALKECEIAI